MDTRVEPRKRIGVVISLLGLLVMLMPLTALGDGHQIRICHATGSETWASTPVPKHQIDDADGHGSFEDGVHPDDIIPPFAAGEQGNNSWDAYPGKNWDAEGQAIWNNDCELPEEEPEVFDLELVKVWAGDEFEDENLEVTLLINGVEGPVEVEDGETVTISESVSGLPEICDYVSDAPESFTVDADDAVEGLITLTITNTVDCEDEVGGITVTTSTTSTTAPAVKVTPTDEVLGTVVEAEELPFTGFDNELLVGMAVLLLSGGLVLLGATGKREDA